MATGTTGTMGTSSWTPGYERTANGKLRAVDLPNDQRVYASWIHWASLIAWISVPVSSGIAFAVPPLVALAMWQIRKADGEFIDDHGREAVNFQISLVLLGLIVFIVGFPTCGAAWLLYLPLFVLSIVGVVMGGLAALRSEVFRYPASLRVIKDPTPPVAS
ncbi:MAG: DUF4870 domain-containing protein [Planctomycetota bacterium]